MEKSQNVGVFTFSLIKPNNSASGLVETLENDVSILRVEQRHGSRISSELDSKLEWYGRISTMLSGKLESLRSLSRIGYEVKEFADKITGSWTLANKQVCDEYARIRVASRTISGTPLATLLQKIRKQANAIKLLLQLQEVIHDKSYITKGYAVFDEIMALLKELDKCDDKVQQYLAICKLTPYLQELDSTVDEYVGSNDLMRTRRRSSSKLTAFPFLVSFLTGELLGNEPIDPNHVLVSNAPRKPVFITKNVVKRKMNIPALPALKIPKNSSYLSSYCSI